MTTETQKHFDDTGKVVFDDYYNREDPRRYFTSLQKLDYRIPGETQPILRDTLKALRASRDASGIKTIDLGCSYGVNAALMKCDVTIEDLYAHYGGSNLSDLSRSEVLERDIRYYQEHQVDREIETVGIDPAAKAVQYGVDAGLIDHGIVRNLEEEPFDVPETAVLEQADLVMSTGCIGYVTEESIEHIVNATSNDRPWMAHSVLRMFSYEPYEEMLRERGYVTETFEGTLPQRKFATDEEQDNVIENLAKMGIEPDGKESDGWYHANFYLSRPVEQAGTSVHGVH